MKFKMLLLFVLLFAFSAIPAMADEGGAKDTIDLIITVQPDAGASAYDIQLQLWVFDDADTLNGATMGFGWDNPNCQMTSGVAGPGVSGFQPPIFYDGGQLSLTNANQRFSFVGIRLFTPGVWPNPTRQLWATYNFTVASGWTNSDVVNIDTFTYNSGVNYKFVSSTGGDYFPHWVSPVEVVDANPATPKTLEVSTDTVEFFGVVNGTNPTMQTFTVSETGGEAIAYTASVDPGWVTLGNATGTTPADVEVNVNIAGLTEGVHILPITVESAEADNSPLTVYAKLTLDPQPVLVVAPDTLKFSAVANGDNPAMQTFNVSDFYGGAIAYNAVVSVGGSWITLGNASGTTPADVEVNVDITGVTAGAYMGEISVTSGVAANSPQTVYVQLTVEPQPELAVSVDTLFFEAVENGDNPAMQTFNVSEFYGGTIPYAAAVSIGDTWIALSNSAGATPADVEVYVNITGITPGVYLGAIEVTSDTASNSPQVVYVKLTVTAEVVIALLVPTDTLEFSAVENGDNPAMQSFLVAMSDDSNVDYTATVGNTWIVLGNATGQTPNNVEVNIDITGVAAGEYFDSVQVASPGVSNSPVFVYVKLTVANQPMLVTSDTTLEFTAVENGPNPAMQTFTVSDFYAGAIPYSAVVLLGADTWITLGNATGTTPDDIEVSLDITGFPAGSFQGHIEITSDTASNSPFLVTIELTVEEPPCVVPVVDSTLLIFTGVEGNPNSDPLSRTFNVTSSIPSDNFDFLIDCSLDTVCTVVSFDVNSAGAGNAPIFGHTPAEVVVTIDPSGLTEGTHEIPFMITSDYENICETFTNIHITVSITIAPPPSADTLVIHNAGVSPGGQFMVPVTFSNSCELKAMGAMITWPTPDIHLDSVSFAESVVAYFDTLQVVIDNDNQVVAIDCDVLTQDYYPPNSQQNFVNLHFSTSCDIVETEYPIDFFGELTPFAYFERNCGSGLEIEAPITDGGIIDVETKPFDFCGWVVEEGTGIAIPGATVELYAYPLDFNTAPIMTAMTGGIGSFLFENVETLPFSLWAYKEGYYPRKVENLDMIDKGEMIYLKPLEVFAFEPHPWFVNYYCGDPLGTSYYYDAPVPVGSIVEARDDAGNLCGQFPVTTAGSYGFMPVYQDDPQTPEIEGMKPDSLVHFFINGEEATTMESIFYPPVVSVPPYQNILVCLEVGVEEVHSCDLSDGWNLISWNVNSANSIDDIFGPYMGNIDVILGFEKGGLTYDPDLLQFSTLDYVDHLSGYWVKVKTGHAFTMEITGSPVPDNTPIMVNKGWNLVSYLPDGLLATETALDNLLLGDNLLVALGYDDSLMVYRPGWQFSTLLEMMTCHGYWLKVAEDGYLIYPGGSGPVAAPAIHPKIIAASGLNASDVTATNQWVNLYSANLTLDGQLVQAGATITAHTASGTKVGSFTLTKDGEFGFMPVYAGTEGLGLKAGDKIYLQIDGVEIKETLTWTNNGDRIEVIQLSAKTNTGTLPETYSLAQNYPNPFNPSTHIGFNMPSEGPAKIEIFNVLGKVVAVPFDGIAGAGKNEIIWNGTNLEGSKVASGIYFYRLTAGDFSETRKMMLLK